MIPKRGLLVPLLAALVMMAIGLINRPKPAPQTARYCLSAGGFLPCSEVKRVYSI